MRKQGASALADSEVAYAVAGDHAQHGGGVRPEALYFLPLETPGPQGPPLPVQARVLSPFQGDTSW